MGVRVCSSAFFLAPFAHWALFAVRVQCQGLGAVRGVCEESDLDGFGFQG